MCVASSNCCLRTIDTGQQQRQQRQHQWRFVEAAGEEERAGMMTGVSHSAVSQGFLNGQSASSLLLAQYFLIFINIFLIVIIIISTRPKPAYGRQGLAGFWGQDTDQAGSFWGVLNVSLRAYGAQLGFKPTRKMKNHKKQPGITKHLHGTMNNHNNYLEPKITIKFHL